MAPQPALGPAEVLAPMAPGQQFSLSGGVGEGPDGGGALLGQGESLQSPGGVRQTWGKGEGQWQVFVELG